MTGKPVTPVGAFIAVENPQLGGRAVRNPESGDGVGHQLLADSFAPVSGIDVEGHQHGRFVGDRRRDQADDVVAGNGENRERIRNVERVAGSPGCGIEAREEIGRKMVPVADLSRTDVNACHRHRIGRCRGTQADHAAIIATCRHVGGPPPIRN